MANPNPSPETRFKPANKLSGRPKGSRDRLTSAFINKLAVDFGRNGKKAIQRCRLADPGAYLRLVASLVPKDVHVRRNHTVTHITELVSETDKWIEETLGQADEHADNLESEPPPVRH